MNFLCTDFKKSEYIAKKVKNRKKKEKMNTNYRFNETQNTILSFFSSRIFEEIKRILASEKWRSTSLEEVRLRAFGPSSLVIGGRCVPLSSRIAPDELQGVFKRVCDMAVFAHRDDICRGFVSIAGGIRVGVIGRARYDGGTIVGVSEISTMVFRLPRSDSSVADELFDEWNRRGRCGMLICSRAGEGKTTAIRALAKIIGSGPPFVRVAVVDERCEFDKNVDNRSTVDILSGYKRALGIDIAIRTISADVIIVDEIGSSDDADAMLSAIGAGIPVIATAHGTSINDVIQRSYIKRLADNGLFGMYAIISRHGESFSLSTGDFLAHNDMRTGEDVCYL